MISLKYIYKIKGLCGCVVCGDFVSFLLLSSCWRNKKKIPPFMFVLEHWCTHSTRSHGVCCHIYLFMNEIKYYFQVNQCDRTSNSVLNYRLFLCSTLRSFVIRAVIETSSLYDFHLKFKSITHCQIMARYWVLGTANNNNNTTTLCTYHSYAIRFGQNGASQWTK